MKSILCSAALVAALFVTGCQTHRSGPVETTVAITSAMPVSFTGQIRADGKVQPVSGTTPAQFNVVANRLDCEVRQGPENGTLTITVTMASHTDHLALVAGSTGPNTDAKGQVTLANN